MNAKCARPGCEWLIPDGAGHRRRYCTIACRARCANDRQNERARRAYRSARAAGLRPDVAKALAHRTTLVLPVGPSTLDIV